MEKRKEQGITLIALVVTIIVLLILAGVTIAMVLGQDGILNKAQTAVERTNESQEIEQVRLAVLEAMTENITGGGLLRQQIEDSINKVYPGATVTQSGSGENTTYTIKLPNDHYYQVDSNGNVTKIEGTPEEPEDTAGIWYKKEGTTLHLSNSDLGGYSKQTKEFDFATEQIPDWVEIDVNDAENPYKSNVTKIVLENELAPINTGAWFMGFVNLTEIGSMVDGEYVANSLVNLNTSNTTTMAYMFAGCMKLTTIDLSHFNTSNVTDMQYMFVACENLINIDLSSFNTSKVTNMSDMFAECNSLANINLTSFDTKNVTNMEGMFKDCVSLSNLDLSNFKTENVTNMRDLFWGCTGLRNLNISSFNTGNVTDMSYMFADCYKLENLDLNHFNTSKVINMAVMFRECTSLAELNLSSFDTSKVMNKGEMFSSITCPVTVSSATWTIQEYECSYSGNFIKI